jgi:hypothetical protein
MNDNSLWTLTFIFGCQHPNSQPPLPWSRLTYEVCLDCGRQVPYSLETASLRRGAHPAGADDFVLNGVEAMHKRSTCGQLSSG